MKKLLKYINESFEELKKTRWLSLKETLNLTIEIIFFSLIFILIYGLFDGFFVQLILNFK